jgi:hypothetical protein
VLAQKTEHIPVTTLKVYLTVDDVKEAATAQTERVTPLEDRPLAVLEDMFDDSRPSPPSRTRGRSWRESPPVPSTCPTANLVVDGVRGVETGQLVGGSRD